LMVLVMLMVRFKFAAVQPPAGACPRFCSLLSPRPELGRINRIHV
jgi:hypothetical protein